MPNVRPPAVAGQFYERDARSLERSLRDCFLHQLGPGAVPEPNESGPGSIAALVSPHAGYMYSGPAAANGFAALAADGVPEIVIIIGPSHFTLGRRAALSSADAWGTPLGEAALDIHLRDTLLQTAGDLLEVDDRAHAREHSLEVQVPFLQFLYQAQMPKLLPICLRSHPMGSIEGVNQEAKALGEALAQALGPRRAVVVASTDFSHHAPQEVAERQDRLALAEIQALRPGGLLQAVVEHDISMCGPAPVAAALWFCLARGAQSAALLRYYTSGDIIGERNSVVGYASLVIQSEGGATP